MAVAAACPDSPPSPAKRATQQAIDFPSSDALFDVANAANEPAEYREVLDTLADTLFDTLTDDWRKLRNALWLVEHLIACTPQLMDELAAEPGMLRGLLGFWAEDEFGVDCGAEVRMRASSILSQLEQHEQRRFENAAAVAAGCQPSYHYQAMQCEEGYATESPTNSEDSSMCAFSPFSASGVNARSHKPAGLSLPAFKLPKLRLRTVALAAATASAAPAPSASGRPPLPASSGSLRGSSSLHKDGSLQRGGGSSQGRADSHDLVAAWGNIRGQDSSDFARMLQLIDDRDFDAAQAAFEQTQRRQPAPEKCDMAAAS